MTEAQKLPFTINEGHLGKLRNVATEEFSGWEVENGLTTIDLDQFAHISPKEAGEKEGLFAIFAKQLRIDITNLSLVREICDDPNATEKQHERRDELVTRLQQNADSICGLVARIYPISGLTLEHFVSERNLEAPEKIPYEDFSPVIRGLFTRTATFVMNKTTYPPRLDATPLGSLIRILTYSEFILRRNRQNQPTS